MSRIGPTLPPHLQKLCTNEESDSSSGDDLYGPALPSHLKPPKCSSDDEFVQSNPSTEKTKVNQMTDSSDDEIIGPLPVDCSDPEQSSSTDIEKRALQMKRKLLGVDDEANKQPKREDWMIELPEIQRKNFGLGPRTFNRTDKPDIESVGRDQWTSTPNSVKVITSKEKEDQEKEIRKQYLEQKRNKKLEKIVSEHDKNKKRDKSLLKAHQKEMKSKRDESSKPKERKPFDRDEDLKLNKLDDAKRKALIKKSQELNSKFKTGNQKFL